MNWNISAWSIRNPVPAILLFVVLTVLGLMAFSKLPITRFPNIDVPLVSVSITDPGVAPSELETQIAKRVEDAVANITGVKNVTSNLTEGNSTTLVEFRLEVDTQKALNDVKDAVERIRDDLPATIKEPLVNSVDVEGASIMTYGISAPAMTSEELSWFVDDKIIRDIQGIKGVGKVERYGGVTREIRVALDPDRLTALAVTAADVNRALKSMNADLTGGRGDLGTTQQTIRTLGASRSLDDLRAIEIPITAGRSVRLDALGTVSDSYEEPKSFARVNNETVVSLAVFRAKGASDAEVYDLVQARIDQLRQKYPDAQFTLIDNSVNYTYGNYESAMSSLVEGAVLSIIVVLLFLRNFRATLIAAVALPLSAIPTFWAIDMLGFSLNLVSLLGITLVTGILVDDAIVEIENIVRHMRSGKSAYRASLEAADEIGLAVIAISATIIAVFAPVSFMSGIAGQYFKQFGLTVAIAVFFSLLVARLITPMMTAYLLRDKKSLHHGEAETGWISAYARFLAITLRFRWLTLGTGIALFAVAIWAMGFLPSGFVPAQDEARVVVSLELPPGARIEETRETTDRAAEKVREIPEVLQTYVTGGASPTGSLDTRRATMIVKLSHKSERDRSQKQVEGAILQQLSSIADLRANFVNDRGEREFAVGVIGSDGEKVSEQARLLQSAMTATGDFQAVSSTAALDRPEIIVRPRTDKLAELGLSTQALSDTLRVATLGDLDANLAKYTVGDRQIPIRVQLKEDARRDLSVLQTLTVTTESGVVVPLESIAEIGFDQGPSTIERFNRQRRVVVGANMANGKEIGEGLSIVQNLPVSKAMPEGVRIQETGDAEVMGEVFAGFRDAMIMGLMLVFVVLILLFGSVFHAFTILMSLPLSIAGVAVALLVTNNSVSMAVVIGILMLMGIVTKNAIMLVDFAIEEVRQGVPRNEAIMDAGRKRIRPIIMTTIAMSAGMLPAAMAFGDGGEFRAPMAIAVIGGLLVSTVLSLVFVPSFYTIMDDASRWMGRAFHWAVRPNTPDEPEMLPVHAASSGHASLRLDLPQAAE
ncbi:efflux RND transporter permease subunit [Phyllobacterium sp. 0TCS1.6C]|uniref:efflux RND transporter permease subunit n=1 Tax=unclassified Phyllobacterium TaxID=2638441 RepID=UPI0022655D39|nr:MULTISPECIES: efflux RND transporter permease subunit [unclassified Phyllobacterium]MCX8280303.1 efflux RND transporter permease subunit [Phyllobacterium sp. 0TCS1.6C]MCX8294136.1 efflux RND transporter permease subunit [Phyllobacterium sp. 0TCS1.6A]